MILHVGSAGVRQFVEEEDPCLHPIAMKKAMRNEAWVEMAARLALDSPNKFPTRTEEAMHKAYGAWKVVEAETRRIDWVANTTGPNKLAATEHKDQHGLWVFQPGDGFCVHPTSSQHHHSDPT